MAILATVTSSGIAASIYPLLSSMWAQNDKVQLFYFYQKGIRIILLITLPISVIFIFWGDILVGLMLERGAFDHSATLKVSQLFAIMVVAFIMNSLGNVVAKIFYLSNKTMVASIMELFGLAYYLIPAFILAKRYGVAGIAMASSISATLSILQSLIYSFIILEHFPVVNLVRDFLKIVICVGGSALVAYYSYSGLVDVVAIDLIRFSLAMVVFSSMYVALLYLFKVEEIIYLKKFSGKIAEKLNVFR
jgi:putative peptidoglycan lipid II flippase